MGDVAGLVAALLTADDQDGVVWMLGTEGDDAALKAEDAPEEEAAEEAAEEGRLFGVETDRWLG